MVLDILASKGKYTENSPEDITLFIYDTVFQLRFPFIRYNVYHFNTHNKNGRVEIVINNKYINTETGEPASTSLEKKIDLYIVENCVALRKQLMPEREAVKVEHLNLNTVMLTIKHHHNIILRKDEIYKLLSKG